MSTLTVQTLQAPTSGANANKLLVGSGHTLHAAGHVIQMVNTSWNTQTAITSQSYTTITGASLAITPKFSTSKILVLVNLSTSLYDGNTGYCNASYQTLRGSTNISGTVPTDGTGTYEIGSYGGGGAVEANHKYTNNIIDSPSTTSATTYSVKGKIYGTAGGTLTVNQGGTAYGTSSLILMEIAQ